MNDDDPPGWESAPFEPSDKAITMRLASGRRIILDYGEMLVFCDGDAYHLPSILESYFQQMEG